MLITNATLITWGQPNQILPGHAICIEDGKIAALGPDTLLRARYPNATLLDARGELVLPGNICAHTHFYGAFSRGLAIPGDAPDSFARILEKLWWPLDKSLDTEDIRYSALLCLVDAIRHGTTTLFDHHASPNAIPGSLDIIADAVDMAGLRAVLCYEVSDRDGPERARAAIAENVRFINRSHKKPLIAASFGLHASLTLSDQTLETCRAELPEGAGFHVHIAESEVDEYDALKKSGLRVVDRFQRHGILGARTIAAHCVHVDAREIALLAETGTWVSHQPRSNMNNAVGVAPVESMLRAGVKVGLGNDGFSNAMWDEWQAAYLLHKLHHTDPRRMNGNTLLEMAVSNNAALASAFFPVEIGTLKPDSAADLIFVDYNPSTPLTPENLAWHMLFGFRDSMITTTIVAGNVLMRDRQIFTLDEKEISARAKELATKVWKRYQERF